MDTQPREPVALYEGPALTWFRGWRLVGLVVVCVLMGAGLRELLWRIDMARRNARSHTPTGDVRAALVHPRMNATVKPLDPNGAPLTLPNGTVTVVNVWLQGCADCMPAFRAWRDLVDRRALPDVSVVNVAYGSADPAWAREYRVDANLHVDDGSQIVNPLGIGTFTTFLIDGAGNVRLRVRPDDPLFDVKLRVAVDVLASATPG